MRFLKDIFDDMLPLLKVCAEFEDSIEEPAKLTNLVERLAGAIREVDLEFAQKEIPQAAAHATDGLARVSEIVMAMKEFSPSSSGELVATDLNLALKSTIAVAESEWSGVATLETQFEPNLPSVPCQAGELNLGLLGLIVNSVQALSAEMAAKDGAGTGGKIFVSTRLDSEMVVIVIEDSSCGVPEDIREKIFDPFFTAKEVGVGTGQGLTLARSVIVDMHAGSIECDASELGGALFRIRPPVCPQTRESEPSEGAKEAE